jgi:hypothetical protein
MQVRMIFDRRDPRVRTEWASVTEEELKVLRQKVHSYYDPISQYYGAVRLEFKDDTIDTNNLIMGIKNTHIEEETN